MLSHVCTSVTALALLVAAPLAAAAAFEHDGPQDGLPRECAGDKEVMPCPNTGFVPGIDEAPNSCTSDLPPAYPEKPVTGFISNPQDRHDFYALQIVEDVGTEVGVELTSSMRLDMSIPQPAFLRVWDPTCSTILAEALPNGAVSEIAQFTPTAIASYPVEVFVGERGQTDDGPIAGVTNDVECYISEFYWACPAGIDQYRFEAFACADRPYAC